VDDDQGFSDTEPLTMASLGNKGALHAGAMGRMAGLLVAGIVLAGGAMGGRRLALLLAVLVLAGLLMASCGSAGGSSPGANEDEMTLEVSGLDAGTTYYWKVVAEDGNGGETESDVRTLTTK
jgi:hypothetical protein